MERSRATPRCSKRCPPVPGTPQSASRQCGEDNVLVEFGPPVLDLELRFQVQALLDTLRARAIPGMLDLTPGIRSLQLHFNPHHLPQTRVLEELRRALAELPDAKR